MRTRDEDHKYVHDMLSAVRHVHWLYFPFGEAERIEGNKRLGREFGYGLASAGLDHVSVSQATYGAMIVANSFDSTSVVIGMHEWQAAIADGVSKWHEYQLRNENGHA